MPGTAVARSTISARGLLLFGALLLGLVIVGDSKSAATAPKPPPVAGLASTAALSQGWALRSAIGLTDSGTTISRVGYATSGWYPVTLPSTVLAGLVANNVYQNIYFGKNLTSIPDLTTQNWWYRGEFTAPATAPGEAYWLRFKGISYRAQIWLNGTQLDANAVGTMAAHSYNVTSLINAGGSNALAILVTPPAHGCKDLSACTVDWNPEAPDMNAGLWGATSLDTTGPVALADPYVKTVLPLPATSSADLTVYVDAVNATNAPATTPLSGTITKPGYETVQTQVVATKNQFQEPVFIANQAASRILAVGCPANQIVDAGLFHSLLGLSHHAGLRNGVNASGQQTWVFLLQETEGVEDGHPSLFHAGCRQRWRSNHISCRINVWNLRLIDRIHLNQTPFAGCQPGSWKVKFCSLAAAPERHQHIGHT